MKELSKFLIVLLGPTGVGKTSLSIQLSNALDAPIVSADSRQFFREMKVGTAAPTERELNQATHYLIGNKSITERYSCGMFELDALNTLEIIFQEHKSALLVGGSMLYIDAICKGIDDFPTPDPELRKTLENQLKNEGIDSLRSQLKILDPEQYNNIDLKNPQRILKAVEVCLQTGRTYSSFLTQPQKVRPFGIVKIGLNRPREELYSMINQRVDKMIENGLVEEVKGLYKYRNHNALKTVGYREIFDFIDGKISLDEAVELIKRNSRRYAKRQLTWWGRDNEITWFHPDDEECILEFMRGKISC
ncbi:MAG TPA: tRNA (adenosine(37)-N6)-dimethylallyltransferase MiaA [Tenuifilaceae bacterium]|nr:tRNA (adenosine(37)-N6)-dimethylallyltransferase MiaA [Tenuifilaceae bacterium]HPE18178.1 tRNA (adenosine(37)-N6)-dimethylallyltransferase MiaA [Tenuifilaceae bacterium]HPJ46657.1 tRNA (adenosine(37)-N6)-dimethylallyltransferase MiaA [Tenuifilaceae bacterium]HPQ34566.1 tRNA (adenosine(37)-N6)-dimethylallyltransferase MiaA [Tenuifilaceae bacterium]HRX68325.1 tRNA (adenosine(37)-N6)-dimethylallyltransferase MiaA [Tenuifilaceae bacterium]